MPSRSSFYLILATAVVLAMMAEAASFAAGTEDPVDLTGAKPVSQDLSLPNPKLNAAQREQIRKALLTKHNEVEFKLKGTKPAKDFTPRIGAKLPKGIKPDGLPLPLIRRIPQLVDYGYAKMKDQILLVNEMSGKIVAIIPETRPQTMRQP